MSDDNYGFPKPADPIHIDEPLPEGVEGEIVEETSAEDEPVATIDDDPKVDIFSRAAEDYISYEDTGSDDDLEDRPGIEQKLSSLLNRYSAESVSGTPDYILAHFLIEVLKSYNEAVSRRAEWRGEFVDFDPSRNVAYTNEFTGAAVKSPGDIQREKILRGEDLPRI